VNWDWSYVARIVPGLGWGLVIALIAAVLGFALALVLGLGIAIARRSGTASLRVPATVFARCVRNTPLLLQLFVIWYLLPQAGLPLVPLAAGILTLGLHYASYVSDVHLAEIDGVGTGQWDAATALHLSRRRTWTSVIIPQAVPRAVGALGGLLVALFSDVPQLVVIAVAEPISVATTDIAQSFKPFEAITTAAVLYLGTTLLLGRIGRVVESRYGTIPA
jgi:polar amino acid transport system permease protein